MLSVFTEGILVGYAFVSVKLMGFRSLLGQ
jgi:hypothetical protein